MNHFKNMARELSLSLRHRKTVWISYWNNKKWGDLFEEEPGGLGAIKPDVAARLFSAAVLSALTADQIGLDALTPSEVENKLCEKYIEYKQKGFWRRLWMRITQPIDTYRQAYTLITLRDLQKHYETVGEMASNLSGVSRLNTDQWGEYFSQAVTGLSACLRSFLPTHVGFFSKIFQREAMYSYVFETNKFKPNIIAKLNDEIESDYAANLNEAFACTTDEQKGELRQTMKNWYNTHKNSITANKAELDSFWGNRFNDLLNRLELKYGLLLNSIQIGNPSKDIPLKPSDYIYIEQKKEVLSATQDNLVQGCTVQINDSTCVFNATYVLRSTFFGYWELLYAETPEKGLSVVDIADFPGLETVLNRHPNDIAAIKQAIVLGHQKRIVHINDFGVEWCAAVKKASPERHNKLLMQEYSQKLEASLWKQTDVTANDLQAVIEKLQAFHHALVEKSNGLSDNYEELQQQSNTYQTLSLSSSNIAKAARIQLIDLLVGNKGQHAGYRDVKKQYNVLYRSEVFLQLPLMLQNALKNEVAEHMVNIKNLLPILQSIHTPTYGGMAWDYMGTFLNAQWKGDIDDYFKNALKGRSENNYPGIVQTLQDISRACFQGYVLQAPCPLSELRAIYIHIENIKQGHVQRIQQGTRTLMVVPTPEKMTVMPHNLLRETLQSRPSGLKSIVPFLLEHFNEALQTPRQHTHVSWITMAEKPTMATLRRLSLVFNPAYIYVKEPLNGNMLYFVNKDTSLIEDIHLPAAALQSLDAEFAFQPSGSRLSTEQALRITSLSTHSHDRNVYLFNILLEALVYRLESVLWGLTDSEILVNDNCGLMRASKEQAERILDSLPCSHYVITPDNLLYYYCKQENTFELHAYLDKTQQELFKNKFPGNQHGYYPWLRDEQIKQIKTVTRYTRDEDARITTKQACDMTKREISQLFRAISPFYHSDKQADSEEWQKLIGAKKAAAIARVDEIVRLQEHLITEYNVLTKPLQNLPFFAVSVFVPGWITRHMEAGVAAQKYCEYMRVDKLIEDTRDYCKSQHEGRLTTSKYTISANNDIKKIDAYIKRGEERMTELLAMNKKLKEMISAKNQQSSEPSKEITSESVATGVEHGRFFSAKPDVSNEHTEEPSDSSRFSQQM